MAVDRDTVTVGTELPAFVRTTGFHNWNRYAAVNDEFVPIHMDDDAGRAQGFPGAFGMGNLMWSYLHNLVRDWMGDDGRIVAMGCSFRSPNLRGMTVEARGTVTAVRDEGGERLVDLELTVRRPRRALTPCWCRRPRPSPWPDPLASRSGQHEDLALVLGLDELGERRVGAVESRPACSRTRRRRRHRARGPRRPRRTRAACSRRRSRR